jgi:hypothetical protein
MLFYQEIKLASSASLNIQVGFYYIDYKPFFAYILKENTILFFFLENKMN